MGDGENDLFSRDVIEADESVIASEREDSVPEFRRFRKYPSIGRSLGNDVSGPIKMVKYFIETSNENPRFACACLRIYVERSLVCPNIFSAVGIEASETPVKATKKYHFSIRRNGRTNFNGEAESAFPNGFSGVGVNSDEFASVRSAIDRAGHWIVCRRSVYKIGKCRFPKNFPVRYFQCGNASGGFSEMFESHERPIIGHVALRSASYPFAEGNRDPFRSVGFPYEMNGAVVSSKTNVFAAIHDRREDVFPLRSFFHSIFPKRFSGHRIDFDEFSGFSGDIGGRVFHEWR